MQKKVLIAIFSLTTIAFFSEIVFLNLKNSQKNSEISKFIKFTNFGDLAFNNGYLRHISTSSIAEIYEFHPGFRESKIQTFINSGFGKNDE